MIDEFPGYGVKCISKLQSHCANMTFANKSRFDKILQQVTHKGGESAMKYIKIFQNSQDLLFSVGNTYFDNQLMHLFLDNSHQGGKYTAKIASHQAELRKEEQFTDRKYLSITYIQIDYLNLDRSSGSDINNERANPVQTKCTFCGGANHSSVFL